MQLNKVLCIWYRFWSDSAAQFEPTKGEHTVYQHFRCLLQFLQLLLNTFIKELVRNSMFLFAELLYIWYCCYKKYTLCVISNQPSLGLLSTAQIGPRTHWTLLHMCTVSKVCQGSVVQSVASFLVSGFFQFSWPQQLESYQVNLWVWV